MAWQGHDHRLSSTSPPKLFVNARDRKILVDRMVEYGATEEQAEAWAKEHLELYSFVPNTEPSNPLPSRPWDSNDVIPTKGSTK